MVGVGGVERGGSDEDGGGGAEDDGRMLVAVLAWGRAWEGRAGRRRGNRGGRR